MKPNLSVLLLCLPKCLINRLLLSSRKVLFIETVILFILVIMLMLYFFLVEEYSQSRWPPDVLEL